MLTASVLPVNELLLRGRAPIVVEATRLSSQNRWRSARSLPISSVRSAWLPRSSTRWPSSGNAVEAQGGGGACSPCHRLPDRVVTTTHCRWRRRHRHPRRHNHPCACRARKHSRLRSFPHLRRLTAAIKEEGAHVAAPHVRRARQVRCRRLPAQSRRLHSRRLLSPAEVRQSLPGIAVVGNISTFLLHQGGTGPRFPNSQRASFARGASMCVPTCGMSSATPLVNILAMTEAAQSRAEGSKETAADV